MYNEAKTPSIQHYKTGNITPKTERVLRDWSIFMGERGPLERGRGPINFVKDILKGPVLFSNFFLKKIDRTNGASTYFTHKTV